MPGKFFHTANHADLVFDELEWFDAWCEGYQELLHAEDYAGLIKLCQERVERTPHDDHAVEALAYAFLEAGESQRAIAVVEDGYRAEPDHDLFQAVIADALRAQGKALDEFPWIRPPRVVSLDSELLSWLHRYLKPKRKPRRVSDLWAQSLSWGYPFFNDDDLLAALQEDARFQVEEPEMMGLAKVSAR